MSDDQFDKIFSALTAIKSKFAAIDQRFGTVATKKQMDAVYNLLDTNISEHQKQEQERAAMAAQLDRLERWVKEVADKTGVSLSYE
jgi:predicted transcriptional regulator